MVLIIENKDKIERKTTSHTHHCTIVSNLTKTKNNKENCQTYLPKSYSFFKMINDAEVHNRGFPYALKYRLFHLYGLCHSLGISLPWSLLLSISVGRHETFLDDFSICSMHDKNMSTCQICILPPHLQFHFTTYMLNREIIRAWCAPNRQPDADSSSQSGIWSLIPHSMFLIEWRTQ